MNDTDNTAALLTLVLHEVRDLRAEVRALRRRRWPDLDRAGDLLVVLAAAVGDYSFTVSDLTTRLAEPERALVHEAIRACCGGLDGVKLGKLLRAIEGQDLRGLHVLRLGEERDGVVWQLSSSSL